MIAATVVIFLMIRSVGGALQASAPTGSTPFGVMRGGPQVDVLLHVLVALGRHHRGAPARARVQAFGQPPVIGEVVAGILLGPSLLGRVAPESAYVLPPLVAPLFGVLAQVGVILYMFLVGSSWTQRLFSEAAHTTARYLAREHHRSLSARRRAGTVPVSAAVQRRRALHRVRAVPGRLDVRDGVPGAGEDPRPTGGCTRATLGGLALACAAVDDVTAWCLLAFVVGIAQAAGRAARYTTVLAVGLHRPRVLSCGRSRSTAALGGRAAESSRSRSSPP